MYQSGIIYARLRKEVDRIYAFCQHKQCPVAKYHAGKSVKQRAANQEDFCLYRKPIMVALNALWMGMYKSNVRFEFHAQIPKD